MFSKTIPDITTKKAFLEKTLDKLSPEDLDLLRIYSGSFFLHGSLFLKGLDSLSYKYQCKKHISCLRYSKRN